MAFLYTEDVGGSSPSAPTAVFRHFLSLTGSAWVRQVYQLPVQSLHRIGHEPG